LGKRVEVLKKFIHTFIEQVPKYLPQYTPIEQKLVTEFIELLSLCESQAQFSREKLSVQLETYSNQIKKRNEYYSTPFLWFTEIYFDNAHLFLRVADFQAYDFHNFLVKYLRGSKELPGAFKLIQEGNSLLDMNWEALQYNIITSFKFPFTEEELSTFKDLYSFIYTAGIDGFNQKKIKDLLVRKGFSERKLTKFIHLITLVDAKWNFMFHIPAFGLRYVFVDFTLKSSSSLEEIIDLNDTNNTTLCNSWLFQVREIPKNYLGYLVVPEHDSVHIKQYLQNCEQQEKLMLNELTDILEIRRSTSLSRYHAREGWATLSSKERQNIKEKMRIKHPRKKRKKIPAFFVDGSFNQEWNYDQNSDPKELISFFSNFSKRITYETLPIHSENPKIAFSKSNTDILKKLIQEQICQPFFTLDRIIFEYSIDHYSVEIPKMPLKQLEYVQRALPHTQLYMTEKKYFLWTHLSPDDFNWITDDLGWKTKNILASKYHEPLNSKWFNTETLQWNTPRVLKLV
jgi:hypothetical protein